MTLPTLIWLTGLPGAGKTTVAKRLIEALAPTENYLLLDGDELRYVMGANLYDIESRRQLALSYMRLAQIVIRQNIKVVCATVSLFDEVREWGREHIDGYYEIFLDTTYAELKKRNQKGLYSQSADNLSQGAADLGFVAEFPKTPDLHINNDGSKSVDEIVQIIVKELAK